MSHCVVFIVMYDVQGDIVQCGDVYVLVMLLLIHCYLLYFLKQL